MDKKKIITLESPVEIGDACYSYSITTDAFKDFSSDNDKEAVLHIVLTKKVVDNLTIDKDGLKYVYSKNGCIEMVKSPKGKTQFYTKQEMLEKLMQELGYKPEIKENSLTPTYNDIVMLADALSGNQKWLDYVECHISYVLSDLVDELNANVGIIDWDYDMSEDCPKELIDKEIVFRRRLDSFEMRESKDNLFWNTLDVEANLAKIQPHWENASASEMYSIVCKALNEYRRVLRCELDRYKHGEVAWNVKNLHDSFEAVRDQYVKENDIVLDLYGQVYYADDCELIK